MSFSDFLEKKLQDHWLGGPDYTRAGTVYVGLSTTTINDDGTGITEPSGGAYARVSTTNNSTNWPAASGAPATKSNGTNIVFPQATADWGTATYFFIADASTGGNILGWGQLTASKVIQNGDTASFAVGALVCTLD